MQPLFMPYLSLDEEIEECMRGKYPREGLVLTTLCVCEYRVQRRSRRRRQAANTQDPPGLMALQVGRALAHRPYGQDISTIPVRS